MGGIKGRFRGRCNIELSSCFPPSGSPCFGGGALEVGFARGPGDRGQGKVRGLCFHSGGPG